MSQIASYRVFTFERMLARIGDFIFGKFGYFDIEVFNWILYRKITL